MKRVISQSYDGMYANYNTNDTNMLVNKFIIPWISMLLT